MLLEEGVDVEDGGLKGLEGGVKREGLCHMDTNDWNLLMVTINLKWGKISGMHNQRIIGNNTIDI